MAEQLFVMNELTLLATTGYIIVTHRLEPLGGFNEDRAIATANHTGRSLVDRILDFGRPEGFGAGSQPSIPNHTGYPPLTGDLTDLAQSVFESSFRGPATSGFDWDHIMDRHTPWGRTAQQSGKKDIFEGLTEPQVKKAVMNAWKNRQKVETQDNQVLGERRVRYRGLDAETGYIVEIWFNQNTKKVETAYPVDRD
jgi:hypothetical protein